MWGMMRYAWTIFYRGCTVHASMNKRRVDELVRRTPIVRMSVDCRAKIRLTALYYASKKPFSQT
jgi:L-fucose isomerase-like protein